MPELATNRTNSGWATVAFGDVVRQVKDKIDPEESGLERYVAGEHMDTDDLRIRRWGEIGGGYLGPAFHIRFKPGHVLYGSRRTYLRKVALADFEGITANTTYVLESRDPNVLLPELLPFIMQTESFHAHSKRESKGSVNPYVNFSDLAWFEFTLPPLNEQRRIADALQGVQSALESSRLAHKRAFHGRVRLCMDIGRRADSAKGAARSSIESSFECLDSRRVPLNETQRNANRGDIPYYGATGRVDTVGEHNFDEPLVLVAEDGGPFNEFDEKPVAYAIEGKSWVNNHAHVLRPRDGEQATWLLMNLMHRDLRHFTTGSTRGKLNKGQLLQVPLWMPDSEAVRAYESAFIGFSVALAKLEHRVNRLQDLSAMVVSETLREARA